jgi:hypothetical protein
MVSDASCAVESSGMLASRSRSTVIVTFTMRPDWLDPERDTDRTLPTPMPSTRTGAPWSQPGGVGDVEIHGGPLGEQRSPGQQVAKYREDDQGCHTDGQYAELGPAEPGARTAFISDCTATPGGNTRYTENVY